MRMAALPQATPPDPNAGWGRASIYVGIPTFELFLLSMSHCEGDGLSFFSFQFSPSDIGNSYQGQENERSRKVWIFC